MTTLDTQAIAEQIYGELESAARADGITFDDEQREYIKQALSDAVLEAVARVEKASPAAAVSRGTSDDKGPTVGPVGA